MGRSLGRAVLRTLSRERNAGPHPLLCFALALSDGGSLRRFALSGPCDLGFFALRFGRQPLPLVRDLAAAGAGFLRSPGAAETLGKPWPRAPRSVLCAFGRLLHRAQRRRHRVYRFLCLGGGLRQALNVELKIKREDHAASLRLHKAAQPQAQVVRTSASPRRVAPAEQLVKAASAIRGAPNGPHDRAIHFPARRSAALCAAPYSSSPTGFAAAGHRAITRSNSAASSLTICLLAI